jgi:hypothetical protein
MDAVPADAASTQRGAIAPVGERVSKPDIVTLKYKNRDFLGN